MKKYLLPLILILLLTFTLTSFSADLFGTYDHRIKLTISDANIDTDLTWFPIMIKLTNAQMEEVFAEFDSDDDFDRIAITLADETTQIYADCERFDDSGSVAEYHAAKTGVVTDADAPGYLYFYYDNDAAHNTTYISMSGDTAAQSVWDGNFKAVYHMNDPDYDIISECDGTTDWIVTNGSQFIDAVDKYSGAGSLKLVTDPAVGEGYVAYSPGGTWDWSSSTHLKVWMKGDTAESGQLFVFDAGANYEYWNFTYPTSWTLMSFDLSAPDGDDGTGCGDWSDINYFRFDINAAEKTARYDEVRIYPATTTLIDSTSNRNIGTKKGTGEPVEATGKVGQGQDFDGGDDIIDMGDANDLDFGAATDFTVEVLINTTQALRGDLLGKGDALDSGDKKWWALYIYEQAGNGGDYVVSGFIDDGTNVVASTKDGTVVNDGNWHHAAMVFDRDGNMSRYIDGSLSGTENAIGAVGDISSTEEFRIGARGNRVTDLFDGIEDEVRISNTIRAAAWLKGTKHSLWDNLLTYGSEEEAPAVEVNVINFAINF